MSNEERMVKALEEIAEAVKGIHAEAEKSYSMLLDIWACVDRIPH
ncbi:MAG TPA: hypothetical protein VGO55_08845 [Allosphingosinicella sp.]|jgi:hypothetical protein|nr:hypothetical protein [Allosphingosinicella sp.]